MAFAASKRTRFTFLATVFALMGALTGSAKAGVIETTLTYPPIPFSFASPTGAGCFDIAAVCVTPGVFTLTSLSGPPTFHKSPSPGYELVDADATYTGSLTGLPTSLLANTDIGSFTLTGTVDFKVNGRSANNVYGTGTIDLTELSLTGTFDIFSPYSNETPYKNINGKTLDACLEEVNGCSGGPSPPSTGTWTITPIVNEIGPGLYTLSYDVTTTLTVYMDVSVPAAHLSKSGIGVSVTAIPEPPAWMLMLAGFAGLGLVRGALKIGSAAGRRAA